MAYKGVSLSVRHQTVMEVTPLEFDNLKKAHYQKIDIFDGIYVVDIQGYIGSSVREEIQYAKENRKEICGNDQEGYCYGFGLRCIGAIRSMELIDCKPCTDYDLPNCQKRNAILFIRFIWHYIAITAKAPFYELQTRKARDVYDILYAGGRTVLRGKAGQSPRFP